MAGQKFVDWAAEQAAGEGFDRSVVAPWFFHHGPKDISMEVHMDDFHGTGPEKEVHEFLKALSLKMVMKYKVHRVGDTYEHLRRLRTISHQGHVRAAEPQVPAEHVEGPGAGAGKPSTDSRSSGQASGGGTISGQRPSESVPVVRVGKALYLSFDRPDIQHAVRELTKEMKSQRPRE